MLRTNECPLACSPRCDRGRRSLRASRDQSAGGSAFRPGVRHLRGFGRVDAQGAFPKAGSGEVPLGPAPSGYPYAWRLGYRIEAAPDGTAYVTFYESSLKRWSTANIFNEGFGKNIGRRGYEIAHVHFDGKTLTGDKPVWMVNTDIAETQFQSGLAVDDNATPWLAVESKSKIRLVQLGGLVKDFAVSGYNFKPSLAISGRTIFLGWHVKDKSGKIWTYYTISYDDGVSFLPPARISNGSWLKKSAPDENGVGLREQASFANGVVYYAYGDARSQLGVYLAQIQT